MNSKMNIFDRVVDLLTCMTMIFCMVALVWVVKNSEPTIIYVEVPRQTEDRIKEEPPEVQEIEELPIPLMQPRYGFSENEIYLMAVLLSGSKYADGDGEYDIDFSGQNDYDQIALVLNVIMNRVDSEQFPDSVSEVIWAPGQFSPMKRWVGALPEVSDISLQRVREWCKAYDTYDPESQVIPDSHLYFHGNGVINISRERW